MPDDQLDPNEKLKLEELSQLPLNAQLRFLLVLLSSARDLSGSRQVSSYIEPVINAVDAVSKYWAGEDIKIDKLTPIAAAMPEMATALRGISSSSSGGDRRWALGLRAAALAVANALPPKPVRGEVERQVRSAITQIGGVLRSAPDREAAWATVIDTLDNSIAAPKIRDITPVIQVESPIGRRDKDPNFLNVSSDGRLEFFTLPYDSDQGGDVVIVIDPGGASSQEIRDVLAALNQLHIACGGLGFVFKLGGTQVLAQSGVTR